MSFDWSNYLDLARELQRQGAIHSSKEAELRSSISRAYYAAFCKARNYLRDRRRLTLSEGPEVHADVQDAFFRINDASLLCIGLADDVLSELRGL